MSRFGFQYHVLPEELLAWLTEWHEQFGIHVALVYYFPDYRVEPVLDVRRLPEEVVEKGPPNEIWANTHSFDLSARTKSGLEKRNSGCLFFQFPKYSKEGLRQVSIGAEMRHGRVKELWEKIAKTIKARCKKGLWVLNPRLKIKGYNKSHRYTDRVAEAAKHGLVLLPIAGGNVMSVEEPDTTDPLGRLPRR